MVSKYKEDESSPEKSFSSFAPDTKKAANDPVKP
jgi:hypothetical protein